MNNNTIKIKVIPYEYIVSESIKMFFDNHQNMLYKENGQYIFISNIDPNVIKNLLLTYMSTIVNDQFHRNLYRLDTLYFIVDDCFPHMNWRRNQHLDKLTGESKKFVERCTMLKYILKERDIKIDELALNTAFDAQFDMFFRDPSLVLTTLGVNNIIFFKNVFMSENDIYEAIRDVFGKYNVEHTFNTRKYIKHVLNANSLVYGKNKHFDTIQKPEELMLTCRQIISILFAKLFSDEGAEDAYYGEKI
jgi:hypothetical protein